MSLYKPLVLGLLAITPLLLLGQPHLIPKEKVIFLTEEWKGDRDSYGRPLVPDEWPAKAIPISFPFFS